MFAPPHQVYEMALDGVGPWALTAALALSTLRGGLVGWYLIGGDGWASKYSEERYNDDFSDVK